ncbi:MAG: DNA polymerase I [Dehalococcoidia bacterium]
MAPKTPPPQSKKTAPARTKKAPPASAEQQPLGLAPETEPPPATEKPSPRAKKGSDGKQRLVILDGHGLIYRAYYAMPEPLTVRATGEVVTAVYGFANSLITVLNELKPTHVAVALDPPGPTFRHEKDVTYKSNRFDALKAQVNGIITSLRAPEEIKQQLEQCVTSAKDSRAIESGLAKYIEQLDVPERLRQDILRTTQPVQALREIGQQAARVRELVEAFGIPVYMLQGYEADDVLGALAKQAEQAGVETFLVTLDSDVIQLVRDRVKVFMMRPYQRDVVIYDDKAARERYGIEPQQMPDLKGLKGDTSDNIPGVPGVGDKTAVKLVQQFGSMENLYAHIDEVEPVKLREKLRDNEAVARHSKDMATIDANAPVTLDLDACEFAHYDRDAAAAFLRELEFKTLVPRLPESKLPPSGDEKRAAAEATVLSGQDYRTIYSEEELDDLVKKLRAAKSFSFDTETTDQHPLTCSLVGMSFSWAEGQAAYIPVAHRPSLGAKEQLPLDAVLAKIGPLLADESLGKIGHNAKFDIEVLGGCGVDVLNVPFDSMIAAYLLGEGGGEAVRPGSGSLGLKWLVSRRLDIEMKPITDLIGQGAKQISMADVPVEDAAPYACADADMTLRLRPAMEADLQAQGLWKLFEEIEMPLMQVLARMEQTGVAIDTDALRKMSRTLAKQIERLERDAYEAVGHEFNLGSPQQLSQVLFEDLGLPKTRKTKQGYTTDASALEALRGAHALVDILLEWRQLTKLKSTYIDSLPALVNPKTNRIHTNFAQTVAATGRLSSQEPNLQNIPVRTELGNEIRRCFIARDYGPDPVLLAADYSQIELRILAHVSQDPALIEAFRNDEDIHAATASSVFGVELDAVTPDQRRRAKVFNFGVLYGLSEFGLSTREGISREEASGFIERYFASYPKVREWRDEAIASCRAKGYAETLVGRRRSVPEIKSANFQVRSAAERIAINMPAQGTASDIIKIAMNQIDAELTERGLTSKMILQVHDELIFELPRKELDTLQEMVLRIMPRSLELVVPLKVDVKVGTNWGELEVMPPIASAKG